jgi:hypothetical protein
MSVIQSFLETLPPMQEPLRDFLQLPLPETFSPLAQGTPLPTLVCTKMVLKFLFLVENE